MTKYYLGVDTSCYTTSIGLLDEAGNCVADVRQLLTVSAGNRGLRQSEMVFQHNRNLPQLWQQLWAKVGSKLDLAAIGVSVAPRSAADSYMPAFLVGTGYARVAALCQHISLYEDSHQENHIYAGLWSAGGPQSKEYLAIHLSGGTTEILRVAQTGKVLVLNLLGGSLDIHAGQLVDRIGVALGLTFPAGQQLEALAETAVPEQIPLFPVAVKDLSVSFSGAENFAKRMLAKGTKPAEIAAGLQLCLAQTLVRLLKKTIKSTGLQEVLLVGGVAANGFIRSYLQSKLVKDGICQLYFPQAVYSSDNAMGAAYYAWRSHVG